MHGALDNGLRILLLVFPASLGYFAGRRKWFSAPSAAISVFNSYALYWAFPALMAQGMLSANFVVPGNIGFWLAIPLSQGLLVGLCWLYFAQLRPVSEPGTIALVALFGNVAFLGLPLAEELLGAQRAGLYSLIAAIHVVLAVGLGPLLLHRWSGSQTQLPLLRLLRQPLLWAPFVGLLIRFLPGEIVPLVAKLLRGPAASAAPVALFMLGLYIQQKQKQTRLLTDSVPEHIGVRLFWAPLLTFAVCWGLNRWGLLTVAQAEPLIVFAAMPAAVTTFSMAHDAGIGAKRVASTVVGSSLLSLLSLPLLLALLSQWLVPLLQGP